MVCYFPVKAYRSASLNPKTGKRPLVFNAKQGLIEGSLSTIPCGNCIGCRSARSTEWGIRSVHEAQMCERSETGSAMLTLTFNDQNLPRRNTVRKRDLQLFMKRLRKAAGVDVKVRFLGCGEYGSKLSRAHYHAVVFGYDFPDLELFSRNWRGDKIYTSAILAKVWPYGFSTVGNVTLESGRYVASYVMKKVTGDRASEHYKRVDPETGECWSVEPEFQLMSLKPGLGQAWIDMFKTDVYPSDFVLMDNRRYKPPRFYDLQLPAEELEALKRARKVKARSQGDPEDRTRRRLKSRHYLAEIKVDRLEREVKFRAGF